MPGPTLHLRGTVLPDGRRDLVVADGVVQADPVAGAEVIDAPFIVPGLVDAHCHVGIATGGVPATLEQCEEQAVAERSAGALLLRDCGSPTDTSSLRGRPDLPEIIRAARHLARPKRYIPGLALDLDDPALLPDAVAAAATTGDGWVKLVGDWIDRGEGDLAPLWPDDVLKAAIDVAHSHGARVTAHVFGTDALPGLIEAGIDCLEHGTGLTEDLIAAMVAHGTALVPTLINIETFPGIAAGAGKYPVYAEHMRDLHRRVRDTVGAAMDAGVPVFAGTDAGGGIAHGRIADEVLALRAAGHPDPVGAASWTAREWLGRPLLEPGAPADLVVYRSDPRVDPEVLREPVLVLLGGHPY
ncbi:amidohydrolase family protein [Pseudonocardia oroxyli]|uniref:Imidazolonepropionase n=1 Tax=Pseudonocardia oroxyli TaxID=366584 RepID=A0A1G7KIC6_PSEOR|nr:amidohydrolase family protein [Pseudonocardia oroxyli]SDF36760.1 Imidazolonepropionase [Pseudonocardia oroxyli]